MVIGEEIELVQEVPDVDTAKWVHLRKRQYQWEPGTDWVSRGISGINYGECFSRQFFWGFFLGEPADAEDLLVFLESVDRHGHVIISLDDLKIGQHERYGAFPAETAYLLEVLAEAAFQQLGILMKQGKLEAIEH